VVYQALYSSTVTSSLKHSVRVTWLCIVSLSLSLLIQVAFAVTYRKLINCCTVHKRNACTLRQNDKHKFKGKYTIYAAEIAKTECITVRLYGLNVAVRPGM